MAKAIIITGPSGVGKGTIEKELFKDKDLNLSFSISATTRPKRDGEIDGVHYYFISKENFLDLINQNKLLEYSEHFDNYYGTPISEVENKIKENKNVLIEVETVGAINIINHYEKLNKLNDLITIFIIPPSFKELKKRIKLRKSDDKQSIRKRMKKAKKELKCKKHFNHVVKNDNIKEAVNEIKNIIRNA